MRARTALAVALLLLAIGAPAHAFSLLRAKQVMRRTVLRTRANITNHVLRAVGIAEMYGLRFSVKTYEEPVSHELWRGSRLSIDGLRDLKNRGFGLVVGLTAERDLDAPAADIGLPHERIAILDNHVPTVDQVRQFFDIIRSHRRNAASRGETPSSVYIHCEAGVGRTGVMVAAYRMKFDGWDAGRAIVEARRLGMKEREQIEFIRSLTKVIHEL
jgi:hypothetical protein